MITIHNSSLAAQPIGFSQPNPANNGNRPVGDAPNNYQQEPSASTPEQIEAAISQTGLPKENNFSQETDRRAIKALQAYNQTLNQLTQNQLQNNIVGIDYYA